MALYFSQRFCSDSSGRLSAAGTFVPRLALTASLSDEAVSLQLVEVLLRVPQPVADLIALQLRLDQDRQLSGGLRAV